jgi:hypothetical protein
VGRDLEMDSGAAYRALKNILQKKKRRARNRDGLLRGKLFER